MRSLADWLAHIERQHPAAIALGLERVHAVRARLHLRLPAPVFTVGGTNGKGSICAMLEAILRASGRRTALYTSPHLLRYNERVRLNGEEVCDEALAEAFAAVEAARGEVPLTYFEFATLAAAWLFARTQPEAIVLEVGLGGRLDAVNAFDADCAVLGAIGIDHVEYLGATREAIGREKAGIFRTGRPAVVRDPDPPASVLDEAARVGARLLVAGRDFDWSVASPGQWTYRASDGRGLALAPPALRGAPQIGNAAAAIAALEAVRDLLPVSAQDVRDGLSRVALPGRAQVLPGRPAIVLDVAHNPQAAGALAESLAAMPRAARTIAVFGMLADKDIGGTAAAIAPAVSRWDVVSLPPPRGAEAARVAAAVRAVAPAAQVHEHASVACALTAAKEAARADDRILVLGSFLTVAQALASLPCPTPTSSTR